MILEELADHILVPFVALSDFLRGTNLIIEITGKPISDYIETLTAFAFGSPRDIEGFRKYLDQNQGIYCGLIDPTTLSNKDLNYTLDIIRQDRKQSLIDSM